jgi:quinolinate synthase
MLMVHADVIKAYRKMSLLAHPDKGGSVKAQQDVNNAMDQINAVKDHIHDYTAVIGTIEYIQSSADDDDARRYLQAFHTAACDNERLAFHRAAGFH